MRHQPTLFFLASLLLLCSCQREKEYSFHKYHVINASLGDSGTRTTFESQAGSYDLLTKWQGHEYIKVFLNVDDGYNDAVRTVQVSKITADGTGATFRYKVPDEWGENDSYKVKMFTSTCLPGIMDGKIYYNASLIREPISSFQVPVFSEGEIVGEGELNASFHHYYTYELLHIKNTSNEDISFTLLGFEEGGWFKQKGSLCIDDGSFVVNAPSTKDPVTSTTVTVKAQESETIVSAYIPTGQPIQMARMVAQVNGQDVKSVNTKSSGVELKQGYAYHMYAGWNGKELKFWSNEEAPLDVETCSAAFDPATFSGLFTGAVTNLADSGVKSVGFRFWRDEDPEDYVEFDATLADDNTFSLTLTYNEFLEIAGDASVKGTYKVSAFAFKPDGSRFHGEILEFTIDKEKPDLPTEPTAGELIDLGLSVRWASQNVGATKPHEVGGFYAWGETETKSTYDWSNYALANGSENSLKKYCTQASYGTVDNRTTLEPSDDAAYAASQGKMRMPTSTEWKELKDKCVWTAMKYEGRDGYLVASPTTGNAIFLPANGFKTGTNYYNSYAPYYWTADLDAYSSQNALMVNYINQWAMGAQVRFEGLGIRPVSDGMDEPTIEVDPTELNFGEVRIGSGKTKSVTVTNTGGGVLTFHLAGGNEWFTYTPEDEVTLTTGQSCELSITFHPQAATQAGVVYRVFSNASNGTKYIKCDGEGVESTVPEMVDLGLPSGLLWASCNLGASKPEEYGDYYAWGETEPYYSSQDPLIWKDGKESGYAFSSYKWCMGDRFTFTKYCSDSSHGYNGFTDAKTVLDIDDDAANVNLGSGWRMPTDAEWTELMENCTWSWTTQNGVYGRLCTASNGNSIFLPAAGYRLDTYIYNVGSHGEYWSSSALTGYPGLAWRVYFYSDGVRRGGLSSCYGFSVRPVCDGGGSSVPVPEIVDLGLSVKWASCNLGASAPEEYGDYYAWGETEPHYTNQDPLTWKNGKELGYEWTTYQWCNESSNAFYKYCTDPRDGNNGYTDGKTVLDLQDDAAHMLLGGKWRMPTKEERDELYNACTRRFITINGISGLELTGPNGNRIFLPFSGVRYDTRLVNDGGRGYYWTSSLANISYSCPDEDAYRFVIMYEPWFDWYFDWENDTNPRFMGQSIRPVYD